MTRQTPSYARAAPSATGAATVPPLARAAGLPAVRDDAPGPGSPAPASPAEPQPQSHPHPQPEGLDAHGFDPAEYDWLPVRRKPRKDGWTPQRQREFIGALAESGSIEHAAMRVQMSPSSAYRLRRSPGAEQFSAAWDVALQHAARVLLDTAFERAFSGSSEPVFDRDGARVGTRFRQNDRLLMFLLRAYLPERFRHAHRDWRSADEALPPPPTPMDEVLRRIGPVCPVAPHTLLAPDELDDALFIADRLDGELPHWHRGRGDTEPPWMPDPAFEERLERLKRGEPDSG